MVNKDLIKIVKVPASYRKRTTLATANFYEEIEVYGNRVIGYKNGNRAMTWYYKDYTGIDVVRANMNSQFSQVVFLTGVNSKRKFVGVDFGATQNSVAMQDTNRIIFCAGMFSFGKSNEFAEDLAGIIRPLFDEYKNNEDNEKNNDNTVSAADEIVKYKNLLDQGIISQEEFDEKKKQLLGL